MSRVDDSRGTSPVADRADAKLFTPGPLTTSAAVRAAMRHDVGSWDDRFIRIVSELRATLLEVAGVTTADGFEAVLLQGSGTYGVEAAISAAVPRGGTLVVAANGAYGDRMAEIAGRLDLRVVLVRGDERQPTDVGALERALDATAAADALAVVHCETTTGVLNPLADVQRAAERRGLPLIIDAMSSFGAYDIDLVVPQSVWLVSSSNKCLQGAPGIAFVIARRASLLASEGRARSLALDLFDQWHAFERTGRFRFTPPTHVLLALQWAMAELGDEGGVAARARRYRQNHAALIEQMSELGFEPYVAAEYQSHIITTFPYPDHPKFRFTEFYERLLARGCVIYPGKLTHAPCFRIGNIGDLTPQDMRDLVRQVGIVLADMGVPTAAAAGAAGLR